MNGVLHEKEAFYSFPVKLGAYSLVFSDKRLYLALFFNALACEGVLLHSKCGKNAFLIPVR